MNIPNAVKILLPDFFRRYDMPTKRRQAAFLAQVGHESGDFALKAENMIYRAERLPIVWPGRFRMPKAGEAHPPEISTFADGLRNPFHYAGQAERLGNYVYAGRLGNGPEVSGDGFRYRGRGFIQITGRENYEKCGNALGLDLIGQPDLLLQVGPALESAGWFWSVRGLNQWADSGQFEELTRRINGGLTGLDDRRARYEELMQSLTVWA